MKCVMYSYRVLVLLILSQQINPAPVSMTYNFRVAHNTKQTVGGGSGKNKTIVALLFDLPTKKYNDIAQNFAGGLASFIYEFEPYYFRMDFAVSHIHEKNDVLHITTFNGTEIDDILFTLGRNFAPTEYTRLALSGLFGIPTHNVVALRHVSFGYKQVGIGLQGDSSYTFGHDNRLFYGLRYIHFISRTALDDVGNRYKYTAGNLVDLLISYKKSWHEKHGMELGYTFRPAFGGRTYPPFDDIVKKTDYLRSTLYILYDYNFLIRDANNILLFNIAGGHDHKPKTYGYKYIITLWASWIINF